MIRKYLIYLLIGLVVFLVSCKNNAPAAGDDPGTESQTESNSEYSNDSDQGDAVEYAVEIARNDITWHFDEEYQCGQFASGDWWVVGPVTIVGISPESIDSDGRITNGAMVNPDPTISQQGYDNSATMPYNASLNVALDVSAENPLILTTGSSLISTISVEEAGLSPIVDHAEILTVLSSAPADGSFRPPYCGSDKTIKFNVSQIDYGVLRTLTPAGTVPDLAEIADDFSRPWLEHCDTSQAGDIHPAKNMPHYGRDLSRKIGIAALMLQLNFTEEQKEDLMINFVQLGIDYYGCIQNGAQWEPDGGIHAGKKFPILFAGIALGDSDMSSIGYMSGDYLYDNGHYEANEPPDYIHFQEDGQTFIVTQRDIDRGVGYNSNHFDMPEWGIRHSTTPSSDNPDWQASYRLGSTIRAWVGWILAARMMEGTASMKTLWNHDVLFDYADRHAAIAYGEDDGWTVPNEATGGLCWDPAFVENMWNTYRNNY